MNVAGSPTVDLIFPCLDEAAALPAVLNRVPEYHHVIVVDNGSSDESVTVAREWGAQVVYEPRRGYGSAVHTGLRNATADIVAVMDCDGSLDPQQLPDLIAVIQSGAADLVVGRRRPTSRSSWPWHARVGNRILARYLRARSGLAVRDIGPVRVARRMDLLSLDIQDRRSGYPAETLLLAARAGWRISELDVAYSPRAAGTRSKVSGTIRGLLIAIYDITRVISRVGPKASEESGRYSGSKRVDGAVR